MQSLEFLKVPKSFGHSKVHIFSYMLYPSGHTLTQINVLLIKYWSLSVQFSKHSKLVSVSSLLSEVKGISSGQLSTHSLSLFSS